MKIRSDYVSNSSSSSFMLVGQAFNDEELEKAWLKLHPEDEKCIDGFDSYELAEKISDELDLTFQRGIDSYYEMWAIGLEFNDMKDNETKKEFIDRIKSSLDKAFEDAKVEAIVDGGYDG